MSEIIGEIAALPPSEQQEVIRFARKLGEASPLTPAELGALAKRLAESADVAEAATLKQKIMSGFYGGK